MGKQRIKNTLHDINSRLSNGVDPQTETVCRQATRYDVPRIVIM